MNETTQNTQTHWPSFLRELEATEQAWRQNEVRYPREDAVPWMPYPMNMFVTLLVDAVKAAPPGRMRGDLASWGRGFGTPTFLDVGCGPGTKMRMARAMFGLDTYGIDIVSRFVAEAQAHGEQAWVKDAFEFEEGTQFDMEYGVVPGYASFQIVYVNRPSSMQDDLEGLVMDRMAKDAVLMAVNWRNNPADKGWIPVAQEGLTPVCGVWVKP